MRYCRAGIFLACLAVLLRVRGAPSDSVARLSQTGPDIVVLRVKGLRAEGANGRAPEGPPIDVLGRHRVPGKSVWVCMCARVGRCIHA